MILKVFKRLVYLESATTLYRNGKPWPCSLLYNFIDFSSIGQDGRNEQSKDTIGFWIALSYFTVHYKHFK